MELTHVKWSFIQVSWLVEKVVFLSIPNEYYIISVCAPVLGGNSTVLCCVWSNCVSMLKLV